MTRLHASTTASGVICFGAFAVGAYTLFDRAEGAARGLTAIKIGATVSGIGEVAAMINADDARSARWIAAQGMFAGSLTLFACAGAATRARPLTVAYSDDVPDHLNQRGPYRWIRHPFYASYLLAYAAGLVATANPVLVPVVIVMSTLYTHAACREQRKFLAGPIRTEYESYRRRTGMFAPRAAPFCSVRGWPLRGPFGCWGQSRSGRTGVGWILGVVVRSRC
jgi:protein-S-isoprenylcysteine O-methyltransferase Ste14